MKKNLNLLATLKQITLVLKNPLVNTVCFPFITHMKIGAKTYWPLINLNCHNTNTSAGIFYILISNEVLWQASVSFCCFISVIKFKSSYIHIHLKYLPLKPFVGAFGRLNATDFLERLRGKRILFVGDSLNRNMWESLVCILRHSVKYKKRVYEASGRSQFKTRGYYSFKFKVPSILLHILINTCSSLFWMWT